LALAAVAWRGLVDGALPWQHPHTPVLPLGLRLAAGTAMGLAIVAGSRWLTRVVPAGARLAEGLGELLGPLSRGQVLVFALASGLAEEAFFRGALQPRVGLLGASVLFALAHFAPRRDLAVWALFALGAGAVFGVLFDWTGDLVAPALAHVIVNGLNLPWLSRRAAPGLGADARDGLDLHGGPERERGDADRAARGLGLAGEVAGVDGVETREVPQVGEEDGGLHDRVE